VLGAGGVIASLLYLAFQIKGDQAAPVASTTQMRAAASRDVGLAVAASEKLAPILAKVSPDLAQMSALLGPTLRVELNDEELLRLTSYWATIIRQWDAGYRMPMSSAEREFTVNQAPTLLSGPMGAFWDLVKGHYPKDFVAEIDRARSKED